MRSSSGTAATSVAAAAALAIDTSGCGGAGSGSGSLTMRHFQLRRQTGSAGQALVWKIYDAIRVEDGKECSLFIFDKKTAEKLHKPKRRETVSEILRREIRYMERFRHPKLLQIWHLIEECSDTISFATEPVWGSLANFFVYPQDVKSNPLVPIEFKEGFTDLELKHGIFQLNEALKYLHNTQKVLHGNLNLGSIIVTKRRCWKLAGLGFVEKSSAIHDAFNFTQWSAKVSKLAQPDLNYMAPELQLQGKATQSCDMFSLGLVIHAVHNGGVSLLDSGRSLQQYQRRVEELPACLPQALMRLPHELADPVEKMLDRESRSRPSADLFGMNKCFQDLLLLGLEGLVTCEAKNLAQKIDFFKMLMTIMMREQFPKTIVYKRVIPLVAENLWLSADLTPFVLPCLLRVIMHSAADEFRRYLIEHTLAVLRRPRSAQTNLVLVEHADILVERLSEEEVRSDLLPLVIATLESNTASGQEAALNAFCVLQDHIDDRTMRRVILPKAKSAFLGGASLTMQVKALACLDQLIDRLDKMIILDEILPFLLEINFSDRDIYMAVIHIYKRMLSDKRFGLTFNLIATRVLPHLIPYTVNPNLRRCDFCVVMETLNVMWMRLESGRSAQMRLEEGGDCAEDSGAGTRPPLITMQQPSVDQEFSLMSTGGCCCGGSAGGGGGCNVEEDEDDKFQHRRRSSSGLQRKEKLKKLNESATSVKSSPDLSSVPPNKRVEAITKLLEASKTSDISNAISRYRDSTARRMSLTRQTSCDSVTVVRRTSHGSASPSRLCDDGGSPTSGSSAVSGPHESNVRRISKTGSSPSFNLRTSPRKGSAIDICGATGLSAEDANRSFTLSLPTALQSARRHSVAANSPCAPGSSNVGAYFIATSGGSAHTLAPNLSAADYCRIPTPTPPGSKPSSRRTSGQSPLTERVIEEASPSRRSSFNALSDTVMSFFAGSGKTNT